MVVEWAIIGLLFGWALIFAAIEYRKRKDTKK